MTARRRRPGRAPGTRRRPAPVAVRWTSGRAFLAPAAVRRAVRAALEEGGGPDFAVAVIVVSDRVLTRMHAEWLDDPEPTDVITFDLSDGTERSGEIYASWQCARRTARERGVEPARELALYVVHGVLHLCGFDDHAVRDRARMRRAEARVMRRLGWPDDLGEHDEAPRKRRAGS